MAPIIPDPSTIMVYVVSIVGGMGSGTNFLSRTPEEFLGNINDMDTQDAGTFSCKQCFYMLLLNTALGVAFLTMAWLYNSITVLTIIEKYLCTT